jgi:hypothetical protein
MELTTKLVPVNNRIDWDHLNIIKKIPEKRTGKARNHGTTKKKKGLSGYCTQIAESADVKLQKLYHGK